MNKKLLKIKLKLNKRFKKMIILNKIKLVKFIYI